MHRVHLWGEIVVIIAIWHTGKDKGGYVPLPCCVQKGLEWIPTHLGLLLLDKL